MVDATTWLLAVTTLLTAIFIWSRRTYVYWQRRRVKFVPPTHLLGNLKAVLKLENSFALQLRDFYADPKFVNEPLIGIYLFHQPALLLRDLALIRTVLVDDFASFSNRFSKCDPCGDKMGAFTLFFAKNPAWKEIRTKLSPVFTNGRAKQMFTLMEEIGLELESYLLKFCQCSEEQQEGAFIVEIKQICDLYATDMIASIAFGLKPQSLGRNSLMALGVHTRQMFLLSLRRAFDFVVIFFLPKLVALLRLKLFTSEHAEFLRSNIKQVVADRERGGECRNDLIEMLLTLKKEAALNPDRRHFTRHKDYLPAQAAAFEIAGIETCASTMAFALYELAKQPKIQTRLRREIQAVFMLGESISYEKVLEMEYLGMVVDETLRKYPIVPFLERECTPVNKKRYYSFRPQLDCFARRGMPVFISNLAIHYDPKYWPEPDIFIPERFSPSNRKSHAPMSYLPFGAGPHNCIGMPMGLMQVKLGLVHLLRHHRVETCSKTAKEIKFDPKFALLLNEGGIYLSIKKCL